MHTNIPLRFTQQPRKNKQNKRQVASMAVTICAHHCIFKIAFIHIHAHGESKSSEPLLAYISQYSVYLSQTAR